MERHKRKLHFTSLIPIFKIFWDALPTLPLSSLAYQLPSSTPQSSKWFTMADTARATCSNGPMVIGQWPCINPCCFLINFQIEFSLEVSITKTCTGSALASKGIRARSRRKREAKSTGSSNWPKTQSRLLMLLGAT